MSTAQHTCIVCAGTGWMALPLSHPSRSVRSDGAILARPMLKAQCGACALVQAVEMPDAIALQTLYRDEYDIYNNRPASERFVAGRYTALAQAITAAVAPLQPKRVLEVGCGNGSALAAVQAMWTASECYGMEPVTSAVKAAQAHGLNVHQGMIGSNLPDTIDRHKYDVIYSIHVVEHTDDPVAFMQALKDMLAPEGRLVITCPHSRVPNLEIMRPDHHYSMMPYHLNALAHKAGLLPVKNALCPGGDEGLDYEHNQLLVCCLPGLSDELAMPLPDYLNESGRQHVFDARGKYFHDFATLDDMLQTRLAPYKRLLCFGTGGWACMLAGYAPGVWERIEACVIDGGSNETFYGKFILSYDRLQDIKPDGIVVGINPATQPMIALRLENDGYNAIRWDNLIAN